MWVCVACTKGDILARNRFSARTAISSRVEESQVRKEDKSSYSEREEDDNVMSMIVGNWMGPWNQRASRRSKMDKRNGEGAKEEGEGIFEEGRRDYIYETAKGLQKQAAATAEGKGSEIMECLRLHGLPSSSCTQRVLTTLLEKEVKGFELVRVELSRGAHKTPQHLALQPFGLIPVLQDGDFFVFESRAIARYVSLKYEKQGNPLYGRTLNEKAHVDQWLEVESQNFHNVASTLVYQLGSRPKQGLAIDEKIVQENIAKLEKVLDVYEARLSDNPFLVGDFFSLADLSHLPRTQSLNSSNINLSHLITSREHVANWWDRISSRSSWQQVQEMAKL